MNIQPISQNTFKGYDARPLKGFLMSSNYLGIADEMAKIGQKERFKIYSPFGGPNRNICKEMVPPNSKRCVNLWAQDYWSIVKDKLFFLEKDTIANSIMKFFNLKPDFTEKIVRETPRFREINSDLWGLFIEAAKINPDDPKLTFSRLRGEREEILKQAHISGGNLFIIDDGESEIGLVGEDELIKYDEDEITGMYGLDDVIVLPQMDFHVDLFIRPLNNKKILLADDMLSLEILENGLQKLHEYKLNSKDTKLDEIEAKYKNTVKIFKEDMTLINKRPQADEVAEILEDAGFDIIRVPGRVYEALFDGENGLESLLKHYCNYINANVLINKEGDLVYITNKSNIDERLGLTPELSEKIGFSFEKSFADSISEYVKPEHLYFVDSEENFVSKLMLFEYQGGIHCICSEVPEI